ncbi:polysialyltransferase family glycosyltransferase [Caminibacter sp.]
MDKNLIFVESPLQLINAFEAVENFDLKDYIIYIRLSGKYKNDLQLKKLAGFLKLDNVKYFNINSSNKIAGIMQFLLFNMKNSIKYADKLFIGNFESKILKMIMKKIDYKELILLDDGAKTIFLHSSFKEKPYDLFTMYDLKPYKGQKIYKNTLQKIKNLLTSLEIDDDTIMFIGSKLSEENIMEEKKYIEVLQKLSEKYKNIIYVPHREESESKLKKIAEIKNIEIKPLDYPVEFYGFYEKTIPYKAVSFYSTALITLKKLYEIEVESLLFDYTSSKHKNAIEKVYEYYKKHIKVTDIDS